MSVIAYAAAGDAPAVTLESIKTGIPDFAKDIRLNFGSVLTPQGAPELSQTQIYGIALASAYAMDDRPLQAALEAALVTESGEAAAAIQTAAKTATSLMAMNNIYYRFTHYAENAAVTGLPAKLRMQAIASPGIEKNDFEMMSLAVSSINGCGKCMAAHTHELMQHGVQAVAVQSVIRLAAVLHATVAARRLA